MHSSNNRGFTLAELLGVLVVLSLLITLAATNVFPMLANSKKKAFINDATILSEAAKTKYQDDKLIGEYSENILNSTSGNVVCYSVKSLIGKYAKTDNKTLEGTVAVCKKESGCSVVACANENCSSLSNISFDNTVIWLKNDTYKINGIKYETLVTGKKSDIIGEGQYFDMRYMGCGRNYSQLSGDEKVYDYSGKEEIYTAPRSGVYQIEVWGAQGGHKNDNQRGYGGYAVGQVRLFQGETIYINVGGEGKQYSGGYNGGGSGKYYAGTWGYGGGGATSVARISGTLDTLQNDKQEIIIVAGGGGGNGGIINDTYPGNSYGGSGGGYKGTSGSKDVTTATTDCAGLNATQTQGGATKLCGGSTVYPAGIFGKGANAYFGSENMKGGAGGGGGFYGGGGSTTGIAGGGGGSGYIGSPSLYTKEMYCYSCDTATGRHQKTTSTTSVSSYAEAKKAKKGNGYFKIKYMTSFPLNDLTIYKNGVAYLFLGTKVSGATVTEPTFGGAAITLPTTNFSMVYTKPLDVKNYNSLIIRKSTAPTSGRVGLRQNAYLVNAGTYVYAPGMTHIADDIYVMDISSIDRNDLSVFANQYNGLNSGDITYLGLSTRTVAEIQADYSFLTS